ncbi:MAG: hypothetical protein COA78_11290 [Blastopirellula sp.]|nr:MAG: hypothetical protein COA78_11290 [Blastopirellula sp.]
MLLSYLGIMILFSVALLNTKTTEAQTVQLPEFHQFGVRTSVLVPVRGSTYLGGVGRNGEYSNGRRGLPFFPGNRSISKSTSRSGMRSSAYLHDFDTMDKALLGADFYRQTQKPSNLKLDTLNISSHRNHPSSVQKTSVDNLSLSAIKELQTAKNAAANQQANKFVAHADKALADGKTNLAKHFLRAAIDEAQGQYKQILTARIQSLEKAPLVVGD